MLVDYCRLPSALKNFQSVVSLTGALLESQVILLPRRVWACSASRPRFNRDYPVMFGTLYIFTLLGLW